MRKRLCRCGCKKTVEVGRTYINGHHRRGKKHSKGTKEILSKKRLSYLSAEQDELSPHRLKFPSKKRGESLSDYGYRKFEYFCSHYCLHVQGKFFGKPVLLMSWQKEILRKLFTVDESGKRIYRRLLVHIPRKQGKTFMASLLILFWLTEESFMDMGAEVISCANTREQSSKTIFRTTRLIVQYSKELDQLVKARMVPASLTNRLTNASYEPLAADSKPQLGRNISLVVFDETLGQPNSDLWDVMSTSQSAREQPLFVSISTAGDSRSSFYYTVYEKMKQIERDPAIDPTTLVSIYECPESVDWRTEEAFKIANPAISNDQEEGFRSEEEIRLMRQGAIDGEGENGYRQYYLNQWSKVGQRTLVSLEAWDKCGNPDLDIEPLKDCQVWAGVDLSSTTDLSSVGVIIESPSPEGKLTVMSFCWLAGSCLSECERRDRLPYGKFIGDGILFFDEQPTIQIESILSFFKKLKPIFPKLKIVGFDPYLGDQLKPIDPYFFLTPIPQQFKFLSPAVKLLKTKILEGNIQHDGNGLLRSMVENARVLEDCNGNIRLDKMKSTSRIDGLVSIAIATAAMIIGEEVVK